MFSARMLRSWMSRFVQPVPSRQTRRALRSRQKHLRPDLETLEDRNAPAVFTVTNTGDNGSLDPNRPERVSGDAAASHRRCRRGQYRCGDQSRPDSIRHPDH